MHLYTKYFDTKDFVLLYYSIIKDQCFAQTKTYVLTAVFTSSVKTPVKMQVVEVNGIEPMASCVQGRRSPN